MRGVRWVLLLLYVGLLGSLFTVALIGDNNTLELLVFGITVAALAMFILGAGRKDLCRPLRRRRLWLPVVAAAFMLAALGLGLTLAFSELLRFKGDDATWSAGPWIALGLMWIFWAVLLYGYTRKLPRYQAIFQLARVVFAGSLAEMLAAVPSHVIVSRRPGCLVGLATTLGIIVGLLVMFWSFGPGIFLLFLQAGRRRAPADEEPPGDEEAGRHAPFQYRLRTLLLVVTLTGVLSGVLRAFWGRWPAAAVLAWGTLLVLIPVVTSNAWILVSTWCGVLIGLTWAFWGEGAWWVLVLPIGLMSPVFLKLFTHRHRLQPPPAAETAPPSDP